MKKILYSCLLGLSAYLIASDLRQEELFFNTKTMIACVTAVIGMAWLFLMLFDTSDPVSAKAQEIITSLEEDLAVKKWKISNKYLENTELGYIIYFGIWHATVYINRSFKEVDGLSLRDRRMIGCAADKVLKMLLNIPSERVAKIINSLEAEEGWTLNSNGTVSHGLIRVYPSYWTYALSVGNEVVNLNKNNKKLIYDALEKFKKRVALRQEDKWKKEIDDWKG